MITTNVSPEIAWCANRTPHGTFVTLRPGGGGASEITVRSESFLGMPLLRAPAGDGLSFVAQTAQADPDLRDILTIQGHRDADGVYQIDFGHLRAVTGFGFCQGNAFTRYSNYYFTGNGGVLVRAPPPQ